MDWVTGIQKSIDYMEENLLSDLDIQNIAKAAHSSAFQFQRVFHILSGLTVGEYIRNRRLTLAANELQSSHHKIIDVAMKYGYESPESYSRAFERFHGVLPSAARKAGIQLKSFSRLSIKVTLEGGSIMDYHITQMPALRLLGKVEKQFIGHVAANLFWERCREDSTLQQLTSLSTSPDKERLGIANSATYDGESYLYYIATPYDGTPIPDGYILKELPARLWVKFRCVSLGAENTADEDIWRKIYSEYFPTSDYEPAEYQVEVYPHGDGSYPDDISEVWIAVKKKTPTPA